MEKFIVTPFDTPSIDLIFGLSFQNRVRCEIRYSDKAEEKEPYILFSTGERIYTEKWLEGDTVDIRFVDAENAHKWMLKEMKLTSAKDYTRSGFLASRSRKTSRNHRKALRHFTKTRKALHYKKFLRRF